MKLLQHFKELTIRPKNAQELKGLILQLAIQGKLTANWREENQDIESVSQLFKEIQKEKKQLIEAKKIKKEKGFTKIKKDEIPYSIPEKWNWYKLAELSSINGGFAFKSSNYIDEGVRVIRISDFDENGFKNHKIVRHEYSDALVSYVLEDKNILIAMTGGTVGKSLFVDKVPEIMVVNQRVATIKIFKPIYEAYINCVIPTKLIQDVIEEAKNSTNDNISMSNIKGFKIPLPPLEEQKEIVKVVETLFKEVEQLEQLTVERVSLKEDFVTSALSQLTTNNANQEWTFLQDHFKSFFNETTNIKKLRETVLQLAVQGKLTAEWRANNPDTEDASVLLKRIQIEKAQLIKDKKIKKEKALPKITKDEIPYELPEGWVWEYLGTSMLKITDGTHHSPANVENGDFKYVSAKNIKSKGVKLSNITYVTEEAHKEIYARCNPELGDLLYIKDGATTGICCINDLDEEFSMLSSVALIKQPKEVLNEYLLRVFRSPYYYDLMRKGMTGVAITRVTLTKLKASIIPIPPLEEQKAIVEKVNALMGLCDRLEQEVQQSQEHSERLMQSCLREVFEGEKEVN
ncbi:restriction endonuclease subunit S [Algibacter lectus]|uniref:Type I restriction-modification system specificity subunit S n=1 Tax=Algibacter lectus TaxID=221126 RepID=A0A090VLB6_9FLAO|nr:restriction endonuclease subunit S [Algibacter lectus]GAL64853.1 type I restriction-modification system specificity subunit S [Algibacter lectus]